MTCGNVKHIVNEPSTLVPESIQGLCYANPHLRWIEEAKVVCRADVAEIASKQVTLIAGGGSGHEPGYGGYVGPGMLTAAVCGHVFASPSAVQVLQALECVQSPHGTLVIVMNYTGDCLNFGLAVERAKARGIKVGMVIIGDDVSVGRQSKVGRRGMAATALAVKMTGAAAARGESLEKVIQVAEYVNKYAATLGVALDHCHVPGSKPLKPLAPDQIELGMGIHNEPGFSKTKLTPAHDLVGGIVDLILKQDDKDRSYLKLNGATKAVLLVNNLGGVSPLELNLVVKEAVSCIVQKHHQLLRLERVYAGTFLTSLNMPGISITILLLEQDQNLDILPLLDYPVKAPGWPCVSTALFTHDIKMAPPPPPQRLSQAPTISSTPIQGTDSAKKLKKMVRSAASSVIEAEPEITRFDTILGDGDCGITLKSAASAILESLDSYPTNTPADTILDIADTIERTVGGTSSAIYCIFLNALAGGLTKHSNNWIKAAAHALEALESYTLARVGDRTMMDALIPFIETLQQSSFEQAVQAAKNGAESTRHLAAQMGRASYVASEDVEKAKLPDAGAWGVAALVQGLYKGWTS